MFFSDVFKAKELEGFELTNIIVSMATLKVNDKNFLTEIIELIKHIGLPKLEV